MGGVGVVCGVVGGVGVGDGVAGGVVVGDGVAGGVDVLRSSSQTGSLVLVTSLPPPPQE